jgi:GAF domain-containing protein
VIVIYRHEVRRFTDGHIALMETFADQAAIAIENARLLTELQAKNADLTEALEQQTATAEILRVISTSPTNIQPVLDTVVKSAARFCGADDAEICHLDGASLRVAAQHGPIPGPLGRLIPVGRGIVAGRAVLERRTFHLPDLQAEAEEFPVGSGLAREFGYRTALVVPLLREGVAVGTINLRRTEVKPFTDKQIALLQTFADQAVIAIENVRLFTELESRNGELRVALEQQTATSELLKVIGPPSISSRSSRRWPRMRSGCAKPSKRQSGASTVSFFVSWSPTISLPRTESSPSDILSRLGAGVPRGGPLSSDAPFTFTMSRPTRNTPTVPGPFPTARCLRSRCSGRMSCWGRSRSSGMRFSRSATARSP